MSEPRALMCFHPEFPDRAYSVIIHDYLSSGDLSRVDCSLDEPRRQHFQQLMRGMPWTKFIRDNANWSQNLVYWMRDRGVILPEGLDNDEAVEGIRGVEGPGFNSEWDNDRDDRSNYDKCTSFSLVDQFFVSGIDDAVFTMVKSG